MNKSNEETESVTSDSNRQLSATEMTNQSVTASARPDTEKTKRQSKPLLALLSVLLIATLGGLATLAGYKAYFEKPSQPSATANTQTQPASFTAAGAIALVSPMLSGTAPSTASSSVPASKPVGYDFYVRPSITEAFPSVARQMDDSQ